MLNSDNKLHVKCREVTGTEATYQAVHTPQPQRNPRDISGAVWGPIGHEGDGHGHHSESLLSTREQPWQANPLPILPPSHYQIPPGAIGFGFILTKDH